MKKIRSKWAFTTRMGIFELIVWHWHFLAIDLISKQINKHQQKEMKQQQSTTVWNMVHCCVHSTRAKIPINHTPNCCLCLPYMWRCASVFLFYYKVRKIHVITTFYRTRCIFDYIYMLDCAECLQPYKIVSRPIDLLLITSHITHFNWINWKIATSLFW